MQQLEKVKRGVTELTTPQLVQVMHILDASPSLRDGLREVIEIVHAEYERREKTETTPPQKATNVSRKVCGPDPNAIVRFRWENTFASGKRSGFAKTFESLDRTKRGAKAFVGGRYLKHDIEDELPVGTLALEVYPTGSVKNGHHESHIIRLGSDGVWYVTSDTTYNYYKEFLSLLDDAAAALEHENTE